MKIFLAFGFCLLWSFVTKLYSQNFSWAVSMGAASLDRGFGVEVNNAGEVLTTGYFRETVDFDPGPGIFNMTSPPGFVEMFIQKLDASGNFLWAKKLNGDSLSGGLSITLDVASNIYITGAFRGTKDFDPGSGVFNLTSSGLNDIFILKLSNSGDFIWARGMGGPGSDIGYRIKLDNIGNSIITGTFQGTADFDPGAGSFNLTSGSQDANGTNVFCVKLDASGNFGWARQLYSTSGQQSPGPITIDSNNNSIYFSGGFFGTVDFDPGPATFNLTTIGNNDLYILKLDVSGNFVWVKRIGVSNFGGIGGVCIMDASSNLYISGGWGGGGGPGTADFDPGPGVFNLTAAFPGVDGFLLKLTANGDFVWVKQFVASNGGWHISTGICVDPGGQIYTTGSMSGTVNFAPAPASNPLNSAGGRDVFAAKYNPSGDLTWAVNMGGTFDEIGNSIAVRNNNVHLTGEFSGSGDFNPGSGVLNLTSNGQEDIFLVKLLQGPCSVPGQPESISGNTLVCAGTAQNYSIGAVPGATSYTWTLPSGWTGSSTTNAINTTSGVNSGNITVNANNSCGAGPGRSLMITVQTVPAQPSSINGNVVATVGQNLTYSINPVNGANGYNWSVSGGGNISSGQNSPAVDINWTAIGNYTVTVSAVNNCGTGTAQSINVAVSAVTGITSPGNPFKLSLTPNPATAHVYLNAKGVINKSVLVEVLNLSGQRIRNLEFRANTNEVSRFISLRALPTGAYLFKIIIDGKVYIRKLILTN